MTWSRSGEREAEQRRLLDDSKIVELNATEASDHLPASTSSPDMPRVSCRVVRLGPILDSSLRNRRNARLSSSRTEEGMWEVNRISYTHLSLYVHSKIAGIGVTQCRISQHNPKSLSPVQVLEA